MLSKKSSAKAGVADVSINPAAIAIANLDGEYFFLKAVNTDNYLPLSFKGQPLIQSSSTSHMKSDTPDYAVSAMTDAISCCGFECPTTNDGLNT